MTLGLPIIWTWHSPLLNVGFGKKITEHSFYEFKPLWRTALYSIEQIALPAEPAIHGRIGAHVIFLFAKDSRDKAHQAASHSNAALRSVLGTSLAFDLRHRADVETYVNRELYFRQLL